MLSGAPCPVALAPRGYAGASRPFERVLAGYDGGDESRIALNVAAQLASAAGVHLHVVVVSEPHAPVRSPAALDLAEIDEHSGGEHATHLAGQAAGDVTAHVIVEREVVVGEPGPALAHAARSEGDLLVVGSRGYGPVRSVVAGTVGHHLSRHANSPVLVVLRGIDAERAGAMLGGMRATP
jgi:nucleotide-binding universal stress UspA family protein